MFKVFGFGTGGKHAAKDPSADLYRTLENHIRETIRRAHPEMTDLGVKLHAEGETQHVLHQINRGEVARLSEAMR